MIETQKSAFSSGDRCDACGAQAVLRAILLQGELLFCGHHGRRYRPHLVTKAVLVQDEPGTLAGVG